MTEVMSDIPSQSDWPQMPAGYKPLAWQGLLLAVPQRWDIGRFAGTFAQGGIRIDNEQRVVAQVKWWKTNGPIALERVVEQQTRTLDGKKVKKSDQPDLQPAAGIRLNADGRWCAFEIKWPKQREIIVVHQREDTKRASAIRFALSEAGQPNKQTINQVLDGYQLRNEQEPAEFAALDFALRSPAEMKVQKTALYSGVSYLRFSRPFCHVGFRRFSAASAVMGHIDPTMENLETWCKAAYSSEFFDRRYRIEADNDNHTLRLIARPRWLALPMWKGLIPYHNPAPRRIDIYWDRPNNKIVCFELLRDNDRHRAALSELKSSLIHTLGSDETSPIRLGNTKRARALAAHVMRNDDGIDEKTTPRGRVSLTFQAIAPQRLRILRALAAQPVGGKAQERTVELDLLGSLIWEACRNRPRVIDLVEQVCREFCISYREAEISVTQYVRTLGQRGLLAIEMNKGG